jgi:hypothetical protein
MTRNRLWAIVGVCWLVAIVGSLFLWSLDPARRPEATIRDELLKATPIGSDESTVDEYAKRHFRQDNFFHWGKDDSGRYLMLCCGSYLTLKEFPFSTCVQASWKFDQQGKLASISVSKWVDAP